MPTVWHYLFMFTAYASLFCCIVFAFSHRNESYGKAVREFLIIALFILAYWLLESWATYLSDYYAYPPDFWDHIPYFDWSQFSWVPPPGEDPCCDVSIQDTGISLSVPVMEASLTYAMMWTARLLAPKLLYMWPFLTGIAMLAFDAFLDPAVALSQHCATDGAQICDGVGFWKWFVHEDLGIWYFCIPLFNWVAWYAAPIALVAFVLLLMWARDFLIWARDRTPRPGFSVSILDGIFKAILVFAFLVLFGLAPSSPIDNIFLQAVIMLVLVIGTIIGIVYYARQGHFFHQATFRWLLVLPQILFYAFALITLLLSGTLALFPLILVGVVCILLGGWYAISPYWKP